MTKIKYNSEDLDNHHGVAAVVKNTRGEILVQKHVKLGFWTIPVGKVKKDQSVEEGLKQELVEECSIVVKEHREIIVKDFFYKRNGKNVKVTGHLFEILKYSGKVKNNEPEKHSRQLFMSLESIMKLPYLSDLTLLYLETIGLKRKARL